MSKDIAQHVAIIMDGNGRWAKDRGLPRSMGHKKGLESVEKAIEFSRKNNIKVLSLYAFSTENWNRSDKEISFLFAAFKEYLLKRKKSLLDNGIRLLISGRREGLNSDLLDTIDIVQDFTKDAQEMVLHICFNYGGSSELVDACKKIASLVEEAKITVDEIDEDLLKRSLYNNLPPVDLMIRTSGECRVSNFMLMQLAYAEFYFTDVRWPDFDEICFASALEEYKNRNRRFGAEV